MSTALVLHASRMGSTADIAQAVSDRLGSRGVITTLLAAPAAPDPTGYDAVIIGSALYVGRW